MKKRFQLSKHIKSNLEYRCFDHKDYLQTKFPDLDESFSNSWVGLMTKDRFNSEHPSSPLPIHYFPLKVLEEDVMQDTYFPFDIIQSFVILMMIHSRNKRIYYEGILRLLQSFEFNKGKEPTCFKNRHNPRAID